MNLVRKPHKNSLSSLQTLSNYSKQPTKNKVSDGDLAALTSRLEACEKAISDLYLPGQKPLKHHFVRRNRIIAGLSDTTVFVEGSLKSGAMITANVALAEGRDVAALAHPSLTANAGGERLISDGAQNLTELALPSQTARV